MFGAFQTKRLEVVTDERRGIFKKKKNFNNFQTPPSTIIRPCKVTQICFLLGFVRTRILFFFFSVFFCFVFVFAFFFFLAITAANNYYKNQSRIICRWIVLVLVSMTLMSGTEPCWFPLSVSPGVPTRWGQNREGKHRVKRWYDNNYISYKGGHLFTTPPPPPPSPHPRSCLRSR